MDSATCLFLLRGEYELRALTFRYHGVLGGEVRSARRLAAAAGVKEHRFAGLPDLKEAAEILGAKFEGLPGTYIPMRNSIFYSYAASYAEEARAQAIVGGHNKDDENVFRDVSSSFFGSLEAALRAGSAILDAEQTMILRPLMDKTKAEVVRLADDLRVPLELTWSCYREGRVHCWECEGCSNRIRSFMEAGVPDPLSRRKTGKIT